MSEFFNNRTWDFDGLNSQGYGKGSIIRVKMINFLTYDECEVFPGPRLNVVLGIFSLLMFKLVKYNIIQLMLVYCRSQWNW